MASEAVIRDLLREAADGLEAIGAGNPRFEAELLLAHALDRPRVFLFTHPEYAPSTAQREGFEELLARRQSSEPLQYVLGTAVFRHLTLRVRPGVLIPRAETEVLVERANEALLRWRADHQADVRPWVIDVGVGSGAILLALMQETLAREKEDLWFRPLGIDIAPQPLHITAENAADCTLPPVHRLLGDLLGAVCPTAPVALIVSNPPYVATAEMDALPAEIREHEPHEALHAGADGLGIIRELLDQCLPFLARGAYVCFEMGGEQEEGVRRELATRNLLGAANVFPDLAHRPRIVLVSPTG